MLATYGMHAMGHAIQLRQQYRKNNIESILFTAIQQTKILKQGKLGEKLEKLFDSVCQDEKIDSTMANTIVRLLQSRH